ncbi:MAG TPA: hypothetical protein VFB45_20885 [Pseudolabrys sp.]|nr:hypothetical protein [Pseudolabrys sp.]
MDHYQEIVSDYLRADRAIFLNTRYRLPGHRVESADKPYWDIDIVALNMRKRRAYLCEVTYTLDAPALLRRFAAWREHWKEMVEGLIAMSGLSPEWQVKAWIFTPAHIRESIEQQVRFWHPDARFTDLELVAPWKYDRERIDVDEER